MARTPRHTPEQLLDFARAAITADPSTRIPDFRATHRIGSGEAQAVLTAAHWEAGHPPYAKLRREDLPARYRELVKPRETMDVTGELDLAALPEVLRRSVDEALDATRQALGTTIESLRHRACVLIAEAEAEAASSIRAALEQAQVSASLLDAADRHAAEAREETAGVREHLNAEITRLTQELRDERRERAVIDQALRRSDVERLRALETLESDRVATRATISDLTQQLGEAQRLMGAAEREVETMRAAVADTRRRLDEATDTASRALRDGAAAEARAALLEETHAAELRRIRELHADEVARLERRIASPATSTKRRQQH